MKIRFDTSQICCGGSSFNSYKWLAWPSHTVPPNAKQRPHAPPLLQLLLYVLNQLLVLGVDTVLGVEQLATFGVARLLQGLDGFWAASLSCSDCARVVVLWASRICLLEMLDYPWSNYDA